MTAWMMLAAALSAQAPMDDQATLLKTFRDEFTAITPGEGKFPADVKIVATDSADSAIALRVQQPYSIGRYEVPQNLYEAVMGKNPSRWKGVRNSVEMVSYAEANEFCEKTTKRLRDAKLIGTDEVVRLPSESEWEYACRAGATTAYSFGDDPQQLGAYAWSTENAAGNDPPVGAKRPNAWGLYDMHGYIAEWCQASSTQKDQRSAPVRGGSWKHTAKECRCDSREEQAQTTRDDAVGFRCVLATEPKK